MSKNIEWKYVKSKATIDDILKVEIFFDIIFPNDFKKCVAENNGGYPKPNRIRLGEDVEVFNNLLDFIPNTYGYIIENYNYVKDRLVEKVIPFADDPFGNLLCFDYREDKIPKIVFWDHEKASRDKEAALSYISSSFTELLNMLQEASDD